MPLETSYSKKLISSRTVMSMQSYTESETAALGRRKLQRRRRTVVSCTECHRRKQKCDREIPCCNCIKRGKSDLCHYGHESKEPQLAHSHFNGDRTSDTIKDDSTGFLTPQGSLSSKDENENCNEIRDFGYTRQSNHNTLGLLQTAVEKPPQTPSSGVSGRSGIGIPSKRVTPSNNGLKYNNLVRELPPQSYSDILIHTFFHAVNWQYDLLTESDFQKELDVWRKFPLSDHSTDLQNMTPELKTFPALLFQVLAQALLFHPPQDDRLEGLLSVTGKSLHDLGVEYSEIGASILSLLGKRCITLATVQGGLLRAAFLKSSGEVVEAWHVLGATIRDAQEIGLHTGRLQAIPSRSPARMATKNRHAQETYPGHKIWVVLHIWDIHMGVVLGRPITTDLRIDDFARTVQDEEKREELFSHWHIDSEPPRPLDIILAGYNVAYRFFPDIHRLEQNAAKPQNYDTVEKIHSALNSNMELLPAWCRLENTDTKFDKIPGCEWLPMAREGLISLIHLVFLALHRPYIFSMASSRVEALKAGIAILSAQERLFSQSDFSQCKVFNPVYASFDAIVIIAVVCLSFPGEFIEQREEGIAAIERGTQRLALIGQFNPMAESAHRVAWALCRRLQSRSHIIHSTELTGSFDDSEAVRASIKSRGNLPIGGSFELSLDNVSPPHPIHDLFYDNLNLSISQMPLEETSNDLSVDPLTVDLTSSWNFEGDFSDNSFWNLLNELQN